MSDFITLIYERKGSVAYVTLNRPEALNSYNTQMRDDLVEVLGAIKADRDIRVVILKGAGEKAFCSGADLSEFLTAPPPVFARQVRWARDVWGLFLSVRQPIIAALHGYVLGSGIEMALCCDLRLASEKARFGLPEVGLGIIPAAGGTQTVPRTIKLPWAMEMVMAGRWIGAEEARRFGLVNRVTSREKLLASAEELAHKIGSFDPAAVRRAKQAVNRGLDLPLAEGLYLESMLARTVRAEAGRSR
jgi:enoyl-CoA hydratase